MEIRDSHFTAQSLQFLFKDILLDNVFKLSERNQYFWQDINFQIIFETVCVLPTFKSVFLKI